MFTHKKKVDYTTDEGRVASTTDQVTGDGEVSFDGTIPTSGTPNVEVDVAFLIAKMKSFLLYSAQAMTVKTNSSGAPDQTITLAAGESLTWTENESAANPITANVTKLFFTNGSASVTSAVKLRVLVDVTP